MRGSLQVTEEWDGLERPLQITEAWGGIGRPLKIKKPWDGVERFSQIENTWVVWERSLQIKIVQDGLERFLQARIKKCGMGWKSPCRLKKTSGKLERSLRITEPRLSHLRFYFRNWHGMNEAEPAVFRHAPRHSEGTGEKPRGTAVLDRASFQYLFEQVGQVLKGQRNEGRLGWMGP